VEELQQVFRLHHAVDLVRLEVAYHLNDPIEGWFDFTTFGIKLFPCLNMVSNEQF
jgi:hypothetical protein